MSFLWIYKLEVLYCKIMKAVYEKIAKFARKCERLFVFDDESINHTRMIYAAKLVEYEKRCKKKYMSKGKQNKLPS